MAATYNFTLSKSDVVNLWRKVQTPLRVAANFMYDEWDMLQDLKDFEVDWSTRTIEAPLDLDEDVGIASIPEGGYEARPGSPNPVDATFTWCVFNGRFSITKTARWIDEKNKSAMLENQMKYQGRKKLDALKRRLSQYFYGYSTATQAKVSSISAGNGTATVTLVLKDPYGQSDTGAQVASFIAGMFRKNEYIALIRAGVIVANAIGKITTITAATPSIVVSFPGNVTAAANDILVYANSLYYDYTTGDATAADQSTDLNKGLTGVLDAMTSTTVQGVSSATNPAWAPGYANIVAGRFNGLKLRKIKQAISNTGGGKLTTILWSQGVENDVTAGLQGGLRFTDSFAMEMDGMPKAKGVSLRSSRLMIPGYVFGWDDKSIAKMVLLDPPGRPTWSDAEKIPDRHGYVLPLDYPCNVVWLNRGNLAYEANKTEQ